MILPVGTNRHEVITATKQGFRVDEVNPYEHFTDRDLPNIQLRRIEMPSNNLPNAPKENPGAPIPQTKPIIPQTKTTLAEHADTLKKEDRVSRSSPNIHCSTNSLNALLRISPILWNPDKTNKRINRRINCVTFKEP